ncbi:hypothetical protein [Pseudoneobacillus rhizosphaerae]|uniref:ATP-binding protein n=1 Tax=Pseudoneobacillus rhizosphaerae TaxID=2880968 RepID=A0A9C7LCR1_9BACI|nr:hypothetical protein [Pseudoneobacillus rhizosphaerae]CAG9610632.1 hypothetical protein NEOCIP111885_04407 [Pseudoneobacillus rhizosphaerae]
MGFKTSVNIRFDVGKDEFINRYIPTPSHTEVLKGLLDGFVKDSNRAHIIVGAYGTGKSLLATVISSIVSKSTKISGVEKLINKFNHFDDYISVQMSAASKLDKKYLPVLLTGNEGRFRQAILSNIIKTLKTEKIEIILPGVSEKILDSVKKWELDFPETYSYFSKLIQRKNKSVEKWIDEIKNQNEDEIKFFNDIYPTLTSGSTFDVGFNESFLTQMEHITKVLDQNNLGLIIVHDEFGRFLQGLSSTNLNETMQDIQDLAELTDREQSLHLMLITHKSLRQYFRGMHEDIAREFQRIEKRFRQYTITSDQATFLKIAEVIMTENLLEKPEISQSLYDYTIEKLKNYSLFPSLNPSEREQIIVKSMFPLHPVTLFILPQLSSVFGQNERTLFTFLESEETGGLINHISKSNTYYKPYQLFDYFFSDSSGNDVDSDISKNLLSYKKAIARIPDTLQNKKLAFNLIKFISIWNLCGLQQEQKITTDFLLFAIQVDEKELISILELLAHQKVIRFNRLGENWEIHTGSTIDIQEKILQKKSEFVINQVEVLKVLSKNLSKRYYFPEKYNDEKEMTRFAKVELLLETNLNTFNTLKNKNAETDLVIYYVIPENKSHSAIIEEILKLSKSEKDIFAIHPKPLSSIRQEILESYIIESFSADKELLSEDKGIKEELIILLKEVNHVIRKFLSTLSTFDENITWLTSREIKQVNSEIEVSELLSNKCYSLYGEAPRIVNEYFNRMNSSSQQISGAKVLIDNIIKSPTESQFGIGGNGPAYSIYASVFKNNNSFDENVNNLDYSNIEYAPYRLLRKKLIEVLEEQPKGSFSEIIDIFTKAPFGIRKPVVPILLVSMLRDRWSEFLLYRNEIFVPGLNGNKLYEILEEEGPENYKYVYEKIDEKYIQFFNSLENYFSNYIEERLEGQYNSRLIQICGTLVKWLRSLPRFTQLSDSVNKEFASLRDAIRKTEVKPQKSIAELYSLYNNDNIIELLRVKEYAECFIFELQKHIEGYILQTSGKMNFEQLLEWAKSKDEYLKKNNELVKSILITNNDDNCWVRNLIENFSGVRIEDWSDITKDKFKKDFQYNFIETIKFDQDDKNRGTGLIKEDSVDYYQIEMNNKPKVITKVDLSVKAKTVYTNIDRIIKNAGRNIPKNELEYIIYLLLEEYIE